MPPSIRRAFVSGTTVLVVLLFVGVAITQLALSSSHPNFKWPTMIGFFVVGPLVALSVISTIVYFVFRRSETAANGTFCTLGLLITGTRILFMTGIFSSGPSSTTVAANTPAPAPITSNSPALRTFPSAQPAPFTNRQPAQSPTPNPAPAPGPNTQPNPAARTPRPAPSAFFPERTGTRPAGNDLLENAAWAAQPDPSAAAILRTLANDLTTRINTLATETDTLFTEAAALPRHDRKVITARADKARSVDAQATGLAKELRDLETLAEKKLIDGAISAPSRNHSHASSPSSPTASRVRSPPKNSAVPPKSSSKNAISSRPTSPSGSSTQRKSSTRRTSRCEAKPPRPACALRCSFATRTARSRRSRASAEPPLGLARRVRPTLIGRLPSQPSQQIDIDLRPVIKPEQAQVPFVCLHAKVEEVTNDRHLADQEINPNVQQHLPDRRTARPEFVALVHDVQRRSRRQYVADPRNQSDNRIQPDPERRSWHTHRTIEQRREHPNPRDPLLIRRRGLC